MRLGFFTLQTLIDAGFSPKAYRYLCLASHYRHFLTFSQENLKAASTAYFKLKRMIEHLHAQDQRHSEGAAEYREKILNALCDDLNAPKAVGLIWDLLQNDQVGDAHKLDVTHQIDQILSLDLLDFTDYPELHLEIPEALQALAQARWEARQAKNWAESDRLRDQII